MYSPQIVYFPRVSSDLHLRRIYLESHGIECRIDGEALLSATPALPVYATLVVKDPDNFEAAKQLIKDFMNVNMHAAQEKWDCPKCKEVLEGQFTDCWKCGYSKP